jgi:hypothetical protein
MTVPGDDDLDNEPDSPKSIYSAFSSNLRFSVRNFSIGPGLEMMSPMTDRSGIEYEPDPFDKLPWRMSVEEFLSEAWNWLSTGLALALNNSANQIIVLVNFLMIGRLNDPLLQASFGLGISYWYYMSMILNIATYEVTGIQCSKFFGRRDFEMMSVSLFQGMIFQGFITLFSCLML